MDQTFSSPLSANTLHCALELSKKSWLLAIQFPDREQPSLYAIEGGDAEKLLAKLTAARDCWAKVSGALPVITLCYEVGCQSAPKFDPALPHQKCSVQALTRGPI